MVTKTPRTDAAASCGDYGPLEDVPTEFARELELENQRLRESLSNAKGWILANAKTPVHGLIESINAVLHP